MSLPVAEFNAFHGIGIALAAWAVIVAVLGMRGFPKNEGAARLAMGITAVLVASTIGAAIATSEKHGEHSSSHGDRENPTHEGETPENAPNE